MHNKLTPQEHFVEVHRAKIEKTGQKAYRSDAYQLYKSLNQSHLPMEHVVEDVIGIYINETEYHRFMENYSKFLDLMYGIKDPIARDMFEKLMIYIQLQK
jgi:hypothetical protein